MTVAKASVAIMLGLASAGCARDRPLETPCLRLAEFQSPASRPTAPGLVEDVRGLDSVLAAAFAMPADMPRPLAARYSDALILSGGGQWGAYGAGVIAGWSGRGRLPARVTTGVSTGALQATFAYLGPQYDDAMTGAYTIADERTLVRRHGSAFFLRHASMADVAPLKRYIQTRVSPLLDAVRDEYRATRRVMLVGAVDALQGTFHTFDLTRMASELHGTERLDCYTAALMASASVPVVFRQTTINGRPWLDGGVRQSMFLPAMVRSIARAKAVSKTRGAVIDTDGIVYALKNGPLAPEPVETLPAKLLPTVNRLRTIVFNQVEQDSLDLSAAYAHRAGQRLFFTTADEWRSFPACAGHESGAEEKIFDPGFMACMIAFGRSRWTSGKTPWVEQTDF